MRGSRYAFNNGTLFYKYPGGAKNHARGDCSDLIEDLCEVKEWPGGRVIINEEKEIVVYRQQDENSWIPFYVGQLENELEFEGVDNNPTDLVPGLLWTGFASHHGARYHLNQKRQIYFRETYWRDDVQVTEKHFVRNVDQDLVDRVMMIKGGLGSFRINEYGHIWAPVFKETITRYYDTDILNVSHIHEQFRLMEDVQKRTIQKYSEPKYNPRSRRKESWFPIYVGNYPEPLNIKREERPHTIINPDSVFFDD